MSEYFNQASIAYNNIVANSNIVTTSFSSDVTLSGSAGSETYNTGDTIVYSYSIINNSGSALSCLDFSSDLGAYECGGGSLQPLDYADGSLRYYVNGVLQPTPAVDASNGLAVSCLNIPVDGNAMLLYSVQVNQYAPLGPFGSIASSANISGEGCCDSAETDVTINHASGIQLSISKSVCPQSGSCSRPVTYTLLIQNNGSQPVVATDNVTITDSFNPILDITEVRFNGELWNNPANYSYNSATGLFTTAAGQITVPAATFTQDGETCLWTTTPGTSTLTITGTIACSQG